MPGPTRAADFADLADDPAPAHIARAPGTESQPRAPSAAEAKAVGPVRRAAHAKAQERRARPGADGPWRRRHAGDVGARRQRHRAQPRPVSQPGHVHAAPLIHRSRSWRASTARPAARRRPTRCASRPMASPWWWASSARASTSTTSPRSPAASAGRTCSTRPRIGAPAALSLSGLLGLAAEGIRNEKPGESPKLLGLPGAQALAGLTSLGLMGTVAEVSLLHFRGNFQNPPMYLPVALPPIAAALTAEAALRPAQAHPPAGEALARHHGGAGRRRHGGSTPMARPATWAAGRTGGRTSSTVRPSRRRRAFSGLALAGFAALALLESHGDD